VKAPPSRKQTPRPATSARSAELDAAGHAARDAAARTARRPCRSAHVDALAGRPSGRRGPEHRAVHAHEQTPVGRRRCYPPQHACSRRPAQLGWRNRPRAAFQVQCFLAGRPKERRGPERTAVHNHQSDRARAVDGVTGSNTALPASAGTARTARRSPWKAAWIASWGSRQWAPQQMAHWSAHVGSSRRVPTLATAAGSGFSGLHRLEGARGSPPRPPEKRRWVPPHFQHSTRPSALHVNTVPTFHNLLLPTCCERSRFPDLTPKLRGHFLSKGRYHRT